MGLSQKKKTHYADKKVYLKMNLINNIFCKPSHFMIFFLELQLL